MDNTWESIALTVAAVSSLGTLLWRTLDMRELAKSNKDLEKLKKDLESNQEFIKSSKEYFQELHPKLNGVFLLANKIATTLAIEDEKIINLIEKAHNDNSSISAERIQMAKNDISQFRQKAFGKFISESIEELTIRCSEIRIKITADQWMLSQELMASIERYIFVTEDTIIGYCSSSQKSEHADFEEIDATDFLFSEWEDLQNAVRKEFGGG